MPAPAHDAQPAIVPGATAIPRRWSALIGGTFRMGSDDRAFAEDGEGPVRPVTLSPFAISCHAVSNLQFGDFVRATGYATDAERYGWSFVFEGLLPQEVRSSFTNRVARNPVVGPGAACLLGAAGRTFEHASWTGWIIRSSMSPGMTRRPTAHGRARGCRPRRNGRWPRAAGSSRRAIPGATSCSPAESIAATSGKEIFPTVTRPTTAISARRRFMPSRRTDTACTTSPATSGNGARISSRRAITASHRHGIP